MNDNNNPKTIYPPKMRNFAENPSEAIISYGKKTFINIPGLGIDPVVSSNIVCPEFDYTEDLTDNRVE